MGFANDLKLATQSSYHYKQKITWSPRRIPGPILVLYWGPYTGEWLKDIDLTEYLRRYMHA